MHRYAEEAGISFEDERLEAKERMMSGKRLTLVNRFTRVWKQEEPWKRSGKRMFAGLASDPMATGTGLNLPTIVGKSQKIQKINGEPKKRILGRVFSVGIEDQEKQTATSPQLW